MFTQTGSGSLTQLNVDAIIVTGSDDENVLISLTITDVPTQNALLSGITHATGAKVNGTCTLKLMNATEYGNEPADVGIDTFNIFQLLSVSPQYFFLSLDASNITISSSDDYEAVNFTAGTWLDPEGADAALGATGSAAVFFVHDAFIELDGYEASNEIDASLVAIDAA